jgi:hypothetical protein
MSREVKELATTDLPPEYQNPALVKFSKTEVMLQAVTFSACHQHQYE